MATKNEPAVWPAGSLTRTPEPVSSWPQVKAVSWELWGERSSHFGVILFSDGANPQC